MDVNTGGNMMKTMSSIYGVSESANSRRRRLGDASSGNKALDIAVKIDTSLVSLSGAMLRDKLPGEQSVGLATPQLNVAFQKADSLNVGAPLKIPSSKPGEILPVFAFPKGMFGNGEDSFNMKAVQWGGTQQ